MFRALSLAIGITLCIIGLEFMVVEKVVMAAERPSASNSAELKKGSITAKSSREFHPPEWMPWSLISTGVVIITYSFTIPRRVKG